MSVRLVRASGQYLERASPFDYNADYTVCGWYLPRVLTGWQGLASVFVNTTNADTIYRRSDTNLFALDVNFAGDGNIVSEDGTTAFGLGTPYFVAMVRSGTTVSAYLGVTPATVALECSGSGSVSGRTAATTLRLGATTLTTDNIDGEMQSWRAYTRALTLAELKAEAASTSATVTSDLWADWWLPILSDLTDHSGAGRDLTAGNGPLTTGALVLPPPMLYEEFDHWRAGRPVLRLESYQGGFDHWLGGRPAETLATQSLVIITGTITSTATLTAPTVALAAAQAATAGTIASGSTATAPTTIVPGAVTLTGALITSTISLAAPTVAVGAVTVTGGTVASSAVLSEPSVAVGGTAILSGTIASGAQTFSPSAAAGAVEVAGGTIASTETLFAGAVAAGALALGGGTVASTTTLTAPATAVGDVAATGGTIVSTATLAAPTVAEAGVVTVGDEFDHWLGDVPVVLLEGYAGAFDHWLGDVPVETLGVLAPIAEQAVEVGTITAGTALFPPTVLVASDEVLTNTTISAGGWTDQLGGTTDLHSPLADTDVDTWDQSPFSPAGATMKLGLTDFPEPDMGEALVLSISCSQVG